MTNQTRSGRHQEPPPGRGAEPRRRLVAAAATILAERGYDATTVKEIAREAGLSPGLFHYYFRSKDELLLEVIAELKTEFGPVKERLGHPAADPADQIDAALAAARDRLDWQPGWYRLRYELFALGLRNPELRPALRDSLAASRHGIAAIVRRLAAPVPPGSPGPPGPPDDAATLAAILLATFDGLALQLLADPAFDLDRAYDLLGRLVRPLLADDPAAVPKS